ncbi:hypothetical protein [Streptomyces sp. NPDC048419]|uniref:hypothetical protein n=1 Tax=Streptomyces sp. NPDC048419 TaxID=3365547 RepID=UPI00371BC3C4
MSGPGVHRGAVETGFLVDTAGRVRADLGGNRLQWLHRDTLRVDAPDTAAGDLTRITLSGPHGQPAPPPGTRAHTSTATPPDGPFCPRSSRARTSRTHSPG